MQTPLLHANPHEGSPCSSPLPVQGIRDPRTTPRGGRLALGFPGGDSDTHWGLGHSWVSPDVALSWGGGWGSLEGDRTRSKGMGGVTGDASPRDGAWVPPTDARASHHPLTVPVGRGGSSDLPPPCPTKPRPLSPAPLSPAPPLPTPPPALLRAAAPRHRAAAPAPPPAPPQPAGKCGAARGPEAPTDYRDRDRHRDRMEAAAAGSIRSRSLSRSPQPGRGPR